LCCPRWLHGDHTAEYNTGYYIQWTLDIGMGS
jgi:hypothetical protein